MPQDLGYIDGMNASLARNWWAVALRGFFGILFGLAAIFLPGATLLSLVLLFSIYMLVDGVFALVAGIRALRRQQRWGMLILEGVMDLTAGAVAFVWPGITLLVFIILLALWAVLSGGFLVAAGMGVRRDHGRWWMVFGGAMSMIYGVLLIISPFLGALVLTWWLGAYALVFGVALLAMGFRLRHRNNLHLQGPEQASYA